MKTYNIVLEKGKEPVEVIPVNMAFSYALYDDLQALVDDEEIIDEYDFLEFLNEHSTEIEENLKELWEDWKTDNQ